MTDTQLDAANKIRASINHYREMLEFHEQYRDDLEWPYNDDECVRLSNALDKRIMDLYRQKIAELEKQFAEV